MPMPEGHDTLPVSRPNPISYTGLAESLNMARHTLANQSTDDIVDLFVSDPWFSEHGPLMLTVVDTTGLGPVFTVSDGRTRVFTVSRDDAEPERIIVRVDVYPARPVDPADLLPPTPVVAPIDKRDVVQGIAAMRECLSGQTPDDLVEMLSRREFTMHGPLGITCWAAGSPRHRYVMADRLDDGSTRGGRVVVTTELLP